MKSKNYPFGGSSLYIATPTADNPASRDTAITQVPYVDETGRTHAIGFDDAGLVNLTQLTAVVKNSTTGFDDNVVCQVLRLELAKQLGKDTPLVVTRNAAGATGSSGRTARKARPYEYWVHPAIASYYLDFIQAEVLRRWFEHQRGLRGWSRDPEIEDSHEDLLTEAEEEIDELNASIVALKQEVNNLSYRWNGTLPYPPSSMGNAGVNVSGFSPRRSTESSNH